MANLAKQCNIGANFFSELKMIPEIYEKLKRKKGDILPSIEELKIELKNRLKGHYSDIAKEGIIEYFIERYNQYKPEKKIEL